MLFINFYLQFNWYKLRHTVTNTSKSTPDCRKSRKTNNKCQNLEQAKILKEAAAAAVESTTPNLRSNKIIVDDKFDLHNYPSELSDLCDLLKYVRP